MGGAWFGKAQAAKAAISPTPLTHKVIHPIVIAVWRQLWQLWHAIPSFVRALINPRDLALFVGFYLVYKKALRVIYGLQAKAMRAMASRSGGSAPAAVKPFEQSWLGFLEPRLRSLTRVMAGLYVANGALGGLANLGYRLRPGTQDFVSTVVATLYAGYFIDELKRFYLPVIWPELQNDMRKAFIYNRTTSVLTWTLVALGLLQVISAFLHIPLASTMAFGGAGGIAFGFAAKGIFENFFGGLTLLLSEPFVPGDMVHFEYGGEVMEGRVERVGWYQTRLRGRDTRPTYIPNNVFLSNLVTNMDRITHRKFEHSLHLPFQDMSLVAPTLTAIKAALKELPKVDLLSPFRVHLVGYGEWGLQISIVLYFATKSFDEFLYLQQLALLEVGRVISECGTEISVPLYTIDFAQRRGASAYGASTAAAIIAGAVAPPQPPRAAAPQQQAPQQQASPPPPQPQQQQQQQSPPPPQQQQQPPQPPLKQPQQAPQPQQPVAAQPAAAAQQPVAAAQQQQQQQAQPPRQQYTAPPPHVPDGLPHVTEHYTHVQTLPAPPPHQHHHHHHQQQHQQQHQQARAAPPPPPQRQPPQSPQPQDAAAAARVNGNGGSGGGGGGGLSARQLAQRLLHPQQQAGKVNGGDDGTWDGQVEAAL